MHFLAEPSVIYRDSFIQSILEFQAEGRQLHYDLKSITSDFGAFVQELLYQKDRANLKPGRVPASEFWLIDVDEFIGRLSLRYELNEYLLKMGGHIGYENSAFKKKTRIWHRDIQARIGKGQGIGIS